MSRRGICLVVAVWATMWAVAANELDSLLHQLDHTIEVRDSLCNERRLGIHTAMMRVDAAGNDGDLYNIYRDLYGLYLSYRVDSAMWVAERRLQCAIRMHDQSKIISASLNLAESYSASADYYNSLETLDTLDRTLMQPYHLKYLYNIYSSTYMRMARADAIHSRRLLYNNKVRAYRDSLLTFFPDNTPEYYNIKSLQLVDDGYWEEALKMMNKCSELFGVDANARALGLMAKIYGQGGDRYNQKCYLARSAIVDLENGKKDYLSLMELAKILNDERDYEHAYKYIRCALEDAMLSGARSRASEILEAVPIIDAAYNQAKQDEMQKLWFAITILVLFLAVVIVAYVLMRKKLRRNSNIADSLRSDNQQLSTANELLVESNALKERCISELFSLHGNNIERFIDYRKQVYRLLRTSQYDAASALAKSTQFESEQTKEVYTCLDFIFLNMYPRFIEEYNAMVVEEARVASDTTVLTPELRVLALIRLGISAGGDIARILNYTPQTVYNYRSRIKSNLIVDYNEFVQKIGVAGEK